MGAFFWTFLAVIPVILYFYIRHNDKGLGDLPPDALKFSRERTTPESARLAASQLAASPISVLDRLPPKTGRRYIIVGGAGFLGGWIVLHLIDRGEDPRRIRILDIRLPTRKDLNHGAAKLVDFYKVDISDAKAVQAAFTAPWPITHDSDIHADGSDITIFHTAANIRFYERALSLVHHSAKVNVEGTRNIISAAQSIGATALVYTSSGSVAVRRSRFWLWPWQPRPDHFVQVLNDDDAILPTRHEHFFSNYAVTKIAAERLVRAAHGSPSGKNHTLSTGCIRPGNGVFGPGGDILCGAYLVRKINPTWVSNILQNFTYVENCSLAHLCYEQRLLARDGTDIGGQAFMITDAGPPLTYGDVCTALETLSDGETQFPTFSPTAMLLLAHVLEVYYLARLMVPWPLSRVLPPLNGDLVNLQPSLFALTTVHLVFDDERARRSAEAGGLGYRPAWTTMEGICKTVEEHKKTDGLGEERSKAGGVSFGFGLVRAERGVKKVAEKLPIGSPADAVTMLN